MPSDFRNIIEELCKEKEIEYDVVSNGWLISDDKFATSEMCKLLNIPVVDETIFYRSTNKNAYAEGKKTYEDMLQYFNENNQNVVLKRTNGTCGQDVYHIEDTDVLEKVYNEIFIDNDTICASPYYNIENEYRAIVLNGEIKLMYKKIKPIVLGDGKKSIAELLREFNPYYFRNYKNDIVLREGEEYQYGWKFNLAAGSLPSLEIDDLVRQEVSEIVLNAAKKLNMNFCSVDVIKCKDEDKYYVMELNTGVMMNRFIKEIPDGYKIAKQIYSEAIDEMMK